MVEKLTVFTCTYNRAHTIGRTYDSLCRQTCKDFLWLVVDDGSQDNTKKLVEDWINEAIIPIQYVYKENGGLHTGYNKAIELMETELCVCIDSDDWMPDDSIEKIIAFWNKHGSNDIAGIVGLDYYKDGKPIGGFLPKVDKCHIYDLSFSFHHKGDKKIVIRVDLFKQVAPLPTYNKEKNFNPMVMISKIDLKYEWLILNENLCYVEYQETGMANGIFRQYLNSPNSFAAMRIENFKFPNAPLTYYVKQYIHLASSSILSCNIGWLKKAPSPIVAFAFLPLGLLMAIYIKYKSLQ